MEPKPRCKICLAPMVRLPEEITHDWWSLSYGHAPTDDDIIQTTYSGNQVHYAIWPQEELVYDELLDAIEEGAKHG